MSEPISNGEVLKILKNRKSHSEISEDFMNYLEKTKIDEKKYTMQTLRKIKDIDKEILCNIVNIQEIVMLNNEQEKKIKKVSN
jgi:hypothetical protein